jgi:DNA-binding GntR family transcriptional regulator
MITNISPSISPSNEQEPKAAKKIHQVLKEEILNGIIEPGTLLSESKLASRFGVSRTPIREALSMLDNDRLIYSLPQRGHQVRTVSFSETVDAFRIRELLEVEAIRLAVHRITDERISYLKQLIEKAKIGDSYNFNYEFHTTIAKASNNRILAEFIEEMLILLNNVLLAHPDIRGSSSKSVEPEVKILEALERRDENAACEAMRAHIHESMEKVLR